MPSFHVEKTLLKLRHVQQTLVSASANAFDAVVQQFHNVLHVEVLDNLFSPHFDRTHKHLSS